MGGTADAARSSTIARSGSDGSCVQREKGAKVIHTTHIWRNATIGLVGAVIVLWIVAGAIIAADALDGQSSLQSAVGLYIGQLAIGNSVFAGIAAYIWYRQSRTARFNREVESLRARAEAELDPSRRRD